jgi:hypothetical protein
MANSWDYGMVKSFILAVLYLNDNLKITINGLPWRDYTLDQFDDEDDGCIHIIPLGLGGATHAIPGIIGEVVNTLIEAGLEYGLQGFTVVMGHFRLSFSGTMTGVSLQKIISRFTACQLKINGQPLSDQVLTHGDVVTVHPVGIGGSKMKMVVVKKPQKKKKKPQQQTMAVIQPKKNKPKKAKSGMSSMMMTADSNTGKWMRMQRDIFCSMYRDARLPGDNRFCTSTYFKTGTISLTMPTGTLKAAYYLCPNPVTGFVDITQFAGGVSTVGSATMLAYPANTFIYECFNNWFNVVAQLRLTGVGWRVRNQQPMQTATGRMYIAPLPDLFKPYGGLLLYFYTMTIASEAAEQLVGGFNPSAVGSSTLLNLPGSQEISVQETIYKDVILRSKVVSDEVYTFKNANAGQGSFNTTLNEAVSSVYATSTGITQTYSDNPDSGKVGVGWTGFVLALEGFPNAATPSYDIEYVYAFEGTPVLGQTNDTPVPTGVTPAVGYSRDLMSRALAYVSSLPYMEFVEGAAQLGFQLYGQKNNLRQSSHRLEF